jgi:nucleotide-binding universal stress UspA family protein
MFQRILVALDGSEVSEAVLPHVVALAKANRSKVQVLQVVDLMGLTLADAENGGAPSGVLSQLQEGASAYVASIAARLKAQGLDADGLTAAGGVATSILRAATRFKADLIAMGTHGRTGAGRWVMGSVADRVLHRAKVPLLLIHPSHKANPTRPVSTVVVPVDGSPLAEQALPYAKDIATKLGAAVRLVRSVPVAWAPPMPLDGAAYSPQLADELAKAEQENLAAAKRYTDGMVRRLAGEKLQASAAVDRGDPGSYIIDQAGGDSLIVMTTHGRSGPSRWLLGSVADRVVRQGGRPVLVVPKA